MMENIIPLSSAVLFFVVISEHLKHLHGFLLSMTMFVLGLAFYWHALDATSIVVYLLSGLMALLIFTTPKSPSSKQGISLALILMVISLGLVNLRDIKSTLLIINLLSLLYHFKLVKTVSSYSQTAWIIVASFMDYLFYKTLMLGFVDQGSTVEWSVLADEHLMNNIHFKLLCLIPLSTFLIRLFIPLKEGNAKSLANNLQDALLFVFMKSLVLVQIAVIYPFYQKIEFFYLAASILLFFLLKKNQARNHFYAVSILLLFTLHTPLFVALIGASIIWDMVGSTFFPRIRYLNSLSYIVILLTLAKLISLNENFYYVYLAALLYIVYLWGSDLLTSPQGNKNNGTL